MISSNTGALKRATLESVRADTKLSVAFDLYRRLRLVQRSPHTIAMYVSDLRRLDAYLGRVSLVRDLTDETVTGLLATQISDGLSPYTANKTRFNLLAFWRWLNTRGVCKTWPNIAPLTVPERVPTCWSPREQQRLFRFLAQLKGDYCNIPRSDWWLGIHELILDSGERIGAILKLEWPNVELTTRWVVFRAETRKGGKRDKIHRLHPNTRSILKRIRHVSRADRVFAWPYSYGSVWNHYARILKSAGLPTDRRSKFHRMRRTTATLFEAAGGNATELLDHSNRRVTRSYLDPRYLNTKQACDLLPRPDPFRKKPR